MKPSDLIEVLPLLLAERRPVFIWGKSGAGKSAVISQVCKEHKLKLNDMRASQLDSIDVRGFPVPDMKTRQMSWLPSADLPTKDDPPGVLFLDELNGAMPTVASALYQLILDHRIGSYVLPEHWSIVAAGNNVGDRGITHQMPAPLNNRFVHIDYDIDAEDWQQRARLDGLHVHIRAYLRLKPQSLHVFDSVQNPRSFPSPRSWYFANQIYCNPTLSPTAKLELLKGTVGEGAAAEFTGFVREIAAMPDIDAILAHPASAMLPGNQSVMYAVVTTLSDKVTASNFDKVMTYVQRLQREIQVVFVRQVNKRDNRIRNTSSYRDWCLANQEILV